MFFSKAREGVNTWWYYVIGVLGVIFALFFGQMPFYLVLAVLRRNADGAGSVNSFDQSLSQLDFVAMGLNPNMGLALILFSYAVGLIGLWMIIRSIHNRPFLSLITPKKKLNWNKILFGFGLWMALTFVFELVNYLQHPENYTFQFDYRPFIGLLLIAITLLPIQTSFEEIFTRGYLMQGLGLATKTRWIPLILTTLLFGSMHLFNPEIAEYGFGVMFAYYMFAGLVLGLMTILDDSLELAIGVHAATNMYAALITTYEGAALKTSALFRTHDIDITGSLVGLVVLSAIFLVLCAIKYKWKLSILWTRIDDEEVTVELVKENFD